MAKPAWLLEKEMRDAAVPVDRRTEASHWKSDMEFPHGDGLLRWNWNVAVPGSLAPDVFYQSMVQDWANQGYDVSEAEALIPRRPGVGSRQQNARAAGFERAHHESPQRSTEDRGTSLLSIRASSQLGGRQSRHAGQSGLPTAFRLAGHIYPPHPAGLDRSIGWSFFWHRHRRLRWFAD